MASAFAFDGSDATPVFSMRPGSFNDEALTEFLCELRALLAGAKATLIGDGPTSHHGRAVKAFLRTPAPLAHRGTAGAPRARPESC